MVAQIIRKIFGSRNERILKQMQPIVEAINKLEIIFTKLTDAELQAKTIEFRSRYANGTNLNQLLPEAFAAVREASRRSLGLRHFDEQLIGGMVLHSGKIAEMRTGEGKTLVATLPCYLNSLTGKGVHVITVNDYLARRDADWMRPVYNMLGLTVGVIVTDLSNAERKEAYAADITYGTNNEFGFDYLRDNMAFSLEDKVQRELHFAIVDEVDSILIDEARTPLIISGPAEESSEHYIRLNRIIPQLIKAEDENSPGDYYLEEKSKQAFLTEAGHQHLEELLLADGLLTPGVSLYDPSKIVLMHHAYAALRAHTLFHRDVDYIVQNNQVVIVDEHTGRLMQGRRWSDGLHQAVEAKENVAIQSENQTLASITFQNYFRLYSKLAGMTGTADTEAYEFQQIYGLEVVVIPTHVPVQRIDHSDKVYLTLEEKFIAVMEDIKQCRERGQPILVGTASIETSEYLSELLEKNRIPHQVLNAKFHEQEAHIIAEAGRPGTVTIATNMAGRGTDIVLGGNLKAELAALPEDMTETDREKLRQDWQRRHDQVVQAGGLHIIGSERHESRRIDNQLRGRSGRQGDPGSSRFYLSLQDNLMRIFASDRVSAIMQKLGMGQGEAIEHPWVTKAIENAQRKVEARNFDIRKQLLEFDDVANEQRKIIYEQRNDLLGSTDISSMINAIRNDVIEKVVNNHIPRESLAEQWDIAGLEQRLAQDFDLHLTLHQWLEEHPDWHEEIIREKIHHNVSTIYQQKENLVTATVLRQIEKSLMLQTLDIHWKEHLASMDHLRQGIHLRGYAQKNPKQEYKREAFELFASLLENLKYHVLSMLFRIQIQTPEMAHSLEEERRQHQPQQMQFQHPAAQPVLEPASEEMELPDNMVPFNAGSSAQQPVRMAPKVGRNQECPCGSGKKYKHCHGTLEQ